MGGIDASTVVAVVFGIISAILGFVSIYIAFKQLQLSALQFSLYHTVRNLLVHHGGAEYTNETSTNHAGTGQQSLFSCRATKSRISTHTRRRGGIARQAYRGSGYLCNLSAVNYNRISFRRPFKLTYLFTYLVSLCVSTRGFSVTASFTESVDKAPPPVSAFCDQVNHFRKSIFWTPLKLDSHCCNVLESACRRAKNVNETRNGS